jgi:hypothetical protein
MIAPKDESWVEYYFRRSRIFRKIMLFFYLIHCKLDGRNPETYAYINSPKQADVSYETMARMTRLFRDGIL